MLQNGSRTVQGNVNRLKGNVVKKNHTQAIHILLLGEDLAQNKILLSNLHKIENFQVQAPSNSTRFLNKRHAVHFDIVILEMEEPLDDSLNRLKKIRQTNPGAKVIITNSGDANDAVAKAFSYGAIDFFPKPLEVDLLSERIHSLLTVN